MAFTNKSKTAVNLHTVTGHVVQNPGAHPVNSKVQQARLTDPSFSTGATLANSQPNTDRRRYVVRDERRR